MLQFLGDRLAQKAVELEIEIDGRKLKLKAAGQQDLLSLLPVVQGFVAGENTPYNDPENLFENPFENAFLNALGNGSEHLFGNSDGIQHAIAPSALVVTAPTQVAQTLATTSPIAAASQPVSVFFSYSHKDEDLRDEIATHLSLLKRQGLITAWHDREITAGAEWSGEIDTHLNAAQIILLLVSANFLASDYCYDVEMAQAIARHERGEACVIPVILKPSDWAGAPFGKLQALPKNAKPITTWANRDEALLNVAQGIRTAVQRMAVRPA
ncbi:toll/interleukin-1 receptor domain-containing protein [Thermoleptolyngbya oregonensis NK1-22]|uniref:Toll/interleukin-1 receptor domain-containing protein n=2 Tax=Thermoleptolyngbya TaxID=2303528 RepID=A0AA97BEP2_9CYAN|nr:toll/interleukin-1 receptor domain-containing protein [Thermoleptolyngbya oregonensis NK1-22]